MASGRVILSTTGIQDEFLTGEPQMTYFLKQFKRHTRFAMETVENPIDGTIDFGNTLNAIIPRKGDIIRNLSIKIELSDIITDAAGANATPIYTDSIGHALIEYCDLVIGGQTIERITGEYMEIFSELSVSNSQQDAYYYLVGKSRNQTIDGGNNTGRKVYIVTLPFYFFRNNQLGIPLYSIYRQEVELKFKFRKLRELVINSGNGNGPYIPSESVEASILRSGILTEYVYLTNEEKDYIKVRPTDYVIEQLQLSRSVIEHTENSKNFRLNFTNPVKELYIVAQSQTSQDNNDWFNFNDGTSPNSSNSFIDTIQLEFNGDIMISEDVADYLYLLYAQPMYYHTRVPKRNIYSYSFALRPEDPEPTGQVNMSRIINKLLKVNMTTNAGSYGASDKRNIRIYAKNYNILRIQDGLAGLLFIDNTFM
tara:strand:- start:659 stop:1930 length:1272 start_codon:yes stop_codon:yes gene_type:complete